MAFARGKGGVPPLPCATRPADYVALLGRDRYGHTLRFYIMPHCPQCQSVATLALRLMPGTGFAALPGEGNGHYAKWPALSAGGRGGLAYVRRYAQRDTHDVPASRATCFRAGLLYQAAPGCKHPVNRLRNSPAKTIVYHVAWGHL